MARRRTFIGIGEALLAELPGRTEPAGLALDVARAAAALGHRGVPIARLGQDSFANELLTHVAGMDGVDHALMQSDPDLPTGRMIVRQIAGVRKETLDHRAAFDNLQWDFDLLDLAKTADVVVFGMLAQRCGQSRSVIVRFLSEARGALVACDLTNRADDTFERAHALRSLELAQLAIIDSTAWSILKFGRTDIAHPEAAQTLMRDAAGGLAAVIWMDPNQPIEVYSSEESMTGQLKIERTAQPTAIVALLHGMLQGFETTKAVDNAEQIVKHISEHPDEAVPDSLRG